jgi:uncharacterized protein YifN (PemK superfamily)
MPITYHPHPGELFICSYPKDMSPPEMVKTRPVIVVSPNLKHRGDIVTVVPLSTTIPKKIMPYHQELFFDPPLPEPWNTNPCWAICDHAMTVSFQRLNLIRLGRDQYGKRKYYRFRLDKERLHAIRKAIVFSIGLGDLKLTNT